MIGFPKILTWLFVILFAIALPSARFPDSIRQQSREPVWWQSTTGVTDSVLPPWTPVRVEGRDDDHAVNVSVWGRTYAFKGSVFPRQIEVLGHSILEGPMVLHGAVDGNQATWQQDVIPQIVEATPAKVQLSSSAEEHGMMLIGTATIEYDGMVRFDLVLKPSRPLRVEDLRLEIPIKSRFASLRSYWPVRLRTTVNSGAVPEEGMFLPFKAFVWLGNEDLGLGWFSEADGNWFPRYPRRAIEIRKDEEQTTLVLHLVDRPITIGAADHPSDSEPPFLSYTFGIQATPVKPWPSDFHSWHLDHSVGYGWDEPESGRQKSNLQLASDRGVKTLVFHESWTEIQNYRSTLRGVELRRLVSATHELGMKMLLYFGYEMSTIAPEWDRYSDLCLVRPRTGGYTRLPEQTAYLVCYRSPWANFLVEGIRDVMEKYEVDGVYLDSTTLPWACMNTDHGCGYRTHDGRIKPTYPIFAVREMMKRISAVVTAKHGGMVNTHQYSCVTTPTLAWATSYWDGEQIATMAPEGKHPLELVSLEAYRAEFMGRNHGIPAEFLVYAPGTTMTTRQALALSLLHDVPVRPSGVGTMLRQISKLWAIWSEFEVDDAPWFPYWSNGDFISTNSDEVKVSFHRHPNSGLLLVISNLGKDQSRAEVKLNMERLEIDVKLVDALDAETGRPVTIREGAIVTDLPPMDFKLVLVKNR